MKQRVLLVGLIDGAQEEDQGEMSENDKVLQAEIDLVTNKWDCPRYMAPDSRGPFEDGDVRTGTTLVPNSVTEVYFQGSWWDRAAFLKGRISAMEEFMKMPHTEMSAKQKQVIEALMDEAVQFPLKWKQPNDAITVFVPISFAGRHGLPESIDADLVTVDKEGTIVQRVSVTYKGMMQVDAAIKLLETEWW